MIKIGEIAKLVNVNVKTVRYYEELGLFTPAHVDKWSGYRYYDDKNIEKLEQILYLKELGFSLKQIKNLNEDTIREKTQELKKQRERIERNLYDLSFYRKEGGEIKMEKTFINREKRHFYSGNGRAETTSTGTLNRIIMSLKKSIKKSAFF